MHLVRVRSLLLVLFAAAAVAAGCGEGTLSSPTGPSQLSDAAAIGMDAPDALASVSEDGPVPAGDALVALDRGRGSNGGRDGKDKEKGKQEKDRSDRGPGSREDDEDSDDKAAEQDDDEDSDEDSDDDRRADRRRNLSGFVTAVGMDSITVRGIIVKVTPTTTIRHGNRNLTLADIKPGDHAQAKGMMSADGLTLTASEIKVEDTGRDNDDEDDDQVTLTGVVAGLPTPPPCSALTFTVGTTIVNTNASTVFDDVACAALVNGNTVEVKGVRRADGSILAARVELQSGPNEVKGAISGLASTAGCPTLSFMVGTTTVTTTGTTVFEEAACVALANGTRVEVEGTLTGTTLAAAKIELDN